MAGMRAYRFIRWLLGRAVRVFFRRIEVAGLDNVPDEGAAGVIFCGNHPNSLLDPVLITTHCGRVVHFAAKDVLWTSRLLRVFLDALGAVPVRRRMDHGDAAGPLDNESMFAALHRVLGDGRAVGIFPEGISHDESQLAPLKTGAARIALGAKREHPDKRIVIVPSGLCYFTRNRFRSSVLVQFGAPIEITTEMATAADQPEVVRQLTQLIAARLRGLTINAESWDQIRVLDAVRRLYQPEGISLEDRVELARRFNEVYPRVKDDPEVHDITTRVQGYVRRLAAVGLKDEALVRRPTPRETALAISEHLVLLFTSLPLFLIGAPLHLPLGLLFRMSRYLAPRKDVVATTKFLVGLLTMLLVYIGLAIGVGWLFGVWWGLAAAVVLPLSGRACVHVLSRADALRNLVLTSVRVLMLGKEVERLRAQRAELAAAVIAAVERHRPADMPALFPNRGASV